MQNADSINKQSVFLPWANQRDDTRLAEQDKTEIEGGHRGLVKILKFTVGLRFNLCLFKKFWGNSDILVLMVPYWATYACKPKLLCVY